MRDGLSRGRVLTAGSLLLGLVLVLGLIVVSRVLTDPGAAPAQVSSGATAEPISSAPPSEIERLHAALHDLGRQCDRPASQRSKRSVENDVTVILTFVQRYPEGTFTIDDETGRPLSLLFTARDTLRGCAPAEAAKVDRALPAEFRDPTGAPS